MAGLMNFFYALLLMSVLTNVVHAQLNIANSEIIVPDTYFSIQEAIDHARAGDSIHVKAGVYLEHIVIEKNDLKIVGENKYSTIIDGQGTGTVVYIKAKSTVFDGFTIKNSGYNFTDSGIYIDQSLKANISDNNVIDNNLGIYLYASSNVVLRNNSMATNRYNFGVYGDNLQGYVHDIDDSNIVDGKPLVYLVNQTDRQPPADSGYVAIVNSTNMTIQDLMLSRNWQSVLIAYCQDSNVKNVTASGNMDAMWILNCSACSIMNSTISDNNLGGLAFVDSSACSVYDNTIVNNVEYGVLLSDSSDNLFYHNNFINNTSPVWLFGTSNNNWDAGYSIGGNFWGNYTCTDEKSGQSQNHTGSDGICDIPHSIDSNNIDRYPLMTLWSPQSLQSPSISLVSYAIGGLVILITCVLILYLVKTRKQKPSIRSLRLHNYAWNWFCLFLAKRG